MEILCFVCASISILTLWGCIKKTMHLQAQIDELKQRLLSPPPKLYISGEKVAELNRAMGKAIPSAKSLIALAKATSEMAYSNDLDNNQSVWKGDNTENGKPI